MFFLLMPHAASYYATSHYAAPIVLRCAASYYTVSHRNTPCCITLCLRIVLRRLLLRRAALQYAMQHRIAPNHVATTRRCISPPRILNVFNFFTTFLGHFLAKARQLFVASVRRPREFRAEQRSMFRIWLEMCSLNPPPPVSPPVAPPPYAAPLRRKIPRSISNQSSFLDGHFGPQPPSLTRAWGGTG